MAAQAEGKMSDSDIIPNVDETLRALKCARETDSVRGSGYGFAIADAIALLERLRAGRAAVVEECAKAVDKLSFRGPPGSMYFTCKIRDAASVIRALAEGRGK